MSVPRIALLLLSGLAAHAQPVEVVKVVSERAERTLRLPGEFEPYQQVDLFARVPGFVEAVNVDRGSVVRKGDLLVRLSAPEMAARIAEAKAKAQALEAERAEAQARAVAAESTYEKLKKASETPGAVAGNELVVAQKTLEAARAAEQAAGVSVKAALASVEAVSTLAAYLEVRAPFPGTITERFVHPGALAGAGDKPLLRLEQMSRLRLVVAVPETEVAGIVPRASVAFTVPAYPGQVFHGWIARIAGSVDVKTRTMPVEVDVSNPERRLAPGMYPEVRWPVRAERQSLLVPASAVAVTTERSFVIRVRDGRAEWVDVKKGARSGDLVEVFGPLRAGEMVVRRASDEIRDGAAVEARPVTSASR
jgi:RND family efflux transporter MFP subunit